MGDLHHGTTAVIRFTVASGPDHPAPKIGVREFTLENAVMVRTGQEKDGLLRGKVKRPALARPSRLCYDK